MWPTFDQHLGGNLPTPNINVLEGPFQQFVGSLARAPRGGQREVQRTLRVGVGGATSRVLTLRAHARAAERSIS